MNKNEWVMSEELMNYFKERERIAGRVRDLLSLSYKELATMEMVAEYYEVDIDDVGEVTNRYRDELSADGVRIYSKSEVKSLIYLNGTEIPTCGLLLYPRSSIYKVGMLLQDCAIAEEFRVQYLNNIETV
ncbi:hypothetical protein DP73_21170 [Desulfosporosinus sp. HMP52]|uniref:hypothetical protein n=1 Tax=Desulfosporosinus sp. HMP52 TaxID=1487923 RepID=UPI00051FE9DB|nr:hypothetical protein [Desulfosporosinus sp. HMP52]KGK81782.1 hypothetical protein DP73_21170 [Desulfosporosinus sp. HMP52]